MPPAGFEPTFSAGYRPQTYALDRAATVTDGLTIRKEKLSAISSTRNLTKIAWNVTRDRTVS